MNAVATGDYCICQQCGERRECYSNYPCVNCETSNEYYGKLSARFDVRSKQLHNMGYVRETLSAYNLAIYVRQRGGRFHAVQSATLSHADERAWLDVIEDCKRFCESVA